MDSLKALLAAKKKNLEDQKKEAGASGSVVLGNGRVFHTRGDLKRLESRRHSKRPLVSTEEARQQGQEDAQAAAGKRLRIEDSQSNQANAGTVEDGDDDDDDDDLDTTELPRVEVRKRLRGMGEPVSYFGESDTERLKRLRKLEKHGKQVQMAELALKGGASTRNVFVDRASGKELDEQNPEDSDDDDDDDNDDDSSDDEDETPEEIAAKKKAALEEKLNLVPTHTATGVELPKKAPKQISDEKMKEKLARKEKRAKLKMDSKRVLKYFKGQLKAWEALLMARPDEVKRSSEGKMKAKQEKQCKDYIRPLFKLCKDRTVPPDILFHLNRIVDHAEEGEFVKANDEYIKLSIGNAAWPMGATSVGIHARKGRENIGEGKVSHIMNDERQRKYLQSVKRLITFAQSQSDADPSKRVM